MKWSETIQNKWSENPSPTQYKGIKYLQAPPPQKKVQGLWGSWLSSLLLLVCWHQPVFACTTAIACVPCIDCKNLQSCCCRGCSRCCWPPYYCWHPWCCWRSCCCFHPYWAANLRQRGPCCKKPWRIHQLWPRCPGYAAPKHHPWAY